MSKLLFLAAVASLTTLLAPPPPPTPIETSQEQEQHRASTENDGTAHQPNARSTQAAKENESVETQGAQHGNKSTPNWITLFTAVIAGSAVIQLIIYGFQAS